MKSFLTFTTLMLGIFAMCSSIAKAQCSNIIDHSGEDIKLLDQEMRESNSPISAQVALGELMCTKNPAIASAAVRWALASDDIDIQNMGLQGKFVRASTLSFSVLSLEDIESDQFDVVFPQNLTPEAQISLTTGLSVSIPLYGDPNENLCFSTHHQYSNCPAGAMVSYGNRAVTITTNTVKGTVNLATDGTLVGMLNVVDAKQYGKLVFIPVRVELN